jgi:hypothetical protein
MTNIHVGNTRKTFSGNTIVSIQETTGLDFYELDDTTGHSMLPKLIEAIYFYKQGSSEFALLDWLITQCNCHPKTRIRIL